MLLESLKRRIIRYMDRAPDISKIAFLTCLNNLARRVAVDSHYEVVDGECRLVIVYDSGERETFKGLRAA